MDWIAFDYFIDSNKRVFYLYLLSSMLITIVYLYNNRKQKRVLLSSKLWLHESAKLDYVYFVVNIYIKALLILPLVVGAKEITFFVYKELMAIFGYASFDLSYGLVVTLYTLSIFIFSDFTRYWVHRLLHSIPILWEFHKVHHSAKVLTPFTFYRVHPIENLLFGFRYSITVGVITGIFFYCFGAVLDFYTILGVNVVVFAFNLLGSNLRHTHVKLKYFTFLETILVSPYMHQIHHSTKYFDKNYGGYLAIWDYWFKSLKKSHEVEVMKFGLNKEQMKAYTTVLQLLFTPLNNIINKRGIIEKIKIYSTAFLSSVKFGLCRR
ncbi:MAG: sterol desaturase family protein [Candidatus Marinarcus sp.]|uniref:sterol desaturase family protein n=1 Tax=Candidatus Marinarcus sp. TaxID=3100987 RepID=UPI003B001021